MELPSAEMEKNAGEQAFRGRLGVQFGTCYICGIAIGVGSWLREPGVQGSGSSGSIHLKVFGT